MLRTSGFVDDVKWRCDATTAASLQRCDRDNTPVAVCYWLWPVLDDAGGAPRLDVFTVQGQCRFTADLHLQI